MAEESSVMVTTIRIETLFVLVLQQIEKHAYIFIVYEFQRVGLGAEELFERERIVLDLHAFYKAGQCDGAEVNLRHAGIRVGVALFLLVPFCLAGHLVIVVKGKHLVFGVSIKEVKRCT